MVINQDLSTLCMANIRFLTGLQIASCMRYSNNRQYSTEVGSDSQPWYQSESCQTRRPLFPLSTSDGLQSYYHELHTCTCITELFSRMATCAPKFNSQLSLIATYLLSDKRMQLLARLYSNSVSDFGVYSSLHVHVYSCLLNWEIDILLLMKISWCKTVTHNLKLRVSMISYKQLLTVYTYNLNIRNRDWTLSTIFMSSKPPFFLIFS